MVPLRILMRFLDPHVRKLKRQRIYQNKFNNSNILAVKAWQVKNTDTKLVKFQLLVDGLN